MKKAKASTGSGSAPAAHALQSATTANRSNEVEPPAPASVAAGKSESQVNTLTVNNCTNLVDPQPVACGRIPKPRPVRASTAQATTITLAPRTIVPDTGNAGEEVSSGEDVSDGFNAPQDRDDDEQSESGDEDLNGGGDDLHAYLAAEQPVWQEKKSSAKGKGKATEQFAIPASPSPHAIGAGTQTRSVPGKYTLPLDDFDNSSGSEFEPEPEEDVEEDDRMSADVVEEEEETPSVNFLAVAKKVKIPTKAQLKRQQLEIPTWKVAPSVPPSASGSASHAVRPSPAPAKVAAGHPHSGSLAFPVIPPPTPLTVISDVLPPPLGDADQDPKLTDSDLDSESEPEGDGDHSAEQPTAHVGPVPAGNPPSHSFVLVLTPGGGPLNIAPQQPHVRVTLQGANIIVLNNIVFANAFPDTFGRSKFAADALKQVARQYGYVGLVQRLKTDDQFLHTLSGVAKQRISNFRGGVKKAAEGYVIGFYGLATLTADECREKVDFLLNNLTYIYPFVYEPNKRSVPWRKPYSHPSLLTLLSASFFQGPASMAAKYPDSFPSSDPDHPFKPEIPVLMLALVGVAIHAALLEWRQGGGRRAVQFAADTFNDAYTEHTTLLKGIKKGSLGAYHTLMHRLYNSASNITPIPSSATSTGSALDFVDINGMDID